MINPIVSSTCICEYCRFFTYTSSGPVFCKHFHTHTQVALSCAGFVNAFIIFTLHIKYPGVLSTSLYFN